MIQKEKNAFAIKSVTPINMTSVVTEIVPKPLMRNTPPFIAKRIPMNWMKVLSCGFSSRTTANVSYPVTKNVEKATNVQKNVSSEVGDICAAQAQRIYAFVRTAIHGKALKPAREAPWRIKMGTVMSHAT
jgi:hypothetical protein